MENSLHQICAPERPHLWRNRNRIQAHWDRMKSYPNALPYGRTIPSNLPLLRRRLKHSTRPPITRTTTSASIPVPNNIHHLHTFFLHFIPHYFLSFILSSISSPPFIPSSIPFILSSLSFILFLSYTFLTELYTALLLAHRMNASTLDERPGLHRRSTMIVVT